MVVWSESWWFGQSHGGWSESWWWVGVDLFSSYVFCFLYWLTVVLQTQDTYSRPVRSVSCVRHLLHKPADVSYKVKVPI
jgi:hypothetical protein